MSKLVSFTEPAGRFERWSEEAAASLAGQTTSFVDAVGVRHEATIESAKVLSGGAAMEITVCVPDEAMIPGGNPPVSFRP